MKGNIMNNVSKLYASDDQRWHAVLERSPNAVGHFWFAVATTGVFCRPNCGARKPLRENVSFYDTIEQATKAGFRPCKRCKPDQVDRGQEAVAHVCRIIEESETSPTLNELAEAVSLSPYYLHRLFKSQIGMTPKAYANQNKGQKIRAHLKNPGTVTTAIYDAGFNASSRFYDQAEGLLGMNPSDFKRGGSGQDIVYGSCCCSLGVLLVAATTKGLCWISLADDESELVGELHKTFPNATLDQNESLERLLAGVLDLIDGSGSQSAPLPLDVRGTAFQYRVWQMLTEIPRGTTTTYKELATRLGNPRAFRAVARACATNPVAVVVPCHRVLRSDGNLAGYRWGLERKEKLLKKENKQCR